MGKKPALLKDLQFWDLIILVVLVCVLVYFADDVIFPGFFGTNSWHLALMTVQNLIEISIMIYTAWKFGFKVSLFIGLVIALADLPHSLIMLDMLDKGESVSDVVTQYAIFAPSGVALAWLTSSRRWAVEKLQLSEENYRAVLTTAMDGFYIVDSKGKLLEVNNSYSRMSGYSMPELLKMHVADLEAAESSPDIAAHLQKVMTQGSDRFETKHRRKDGSIFEIEASVQYRAIDGGQFVCFMRDLTETRKLQQQLLMQDRLSSIGQLVAGVAHEINNPLTGVIGFSDLLLQRDLPDDVKDDLKIVREEAQRAAMIVRNLLTFSRQQPQGKTEVQINEQIKVVLALREHQEKLNNVQVNTHFAGGLPTVSGNASQLQQVFLNLIINAEQAIAEVRDKGTIDITTELSGDIIKVSFTDDGAGISPDNMSKLFTPFFTTKGVGKGTGLGLSISHGIITEHGGKIYARSSPGSGATFVIELPVSKQ